MHARDEITGAFNEVNKRLDQLPLLPHPPLSPFPLRASPAQTKQSKLPGGFRNVFSTSSSASGSSRPHGYHQLDQSLAKEDRAGGQGGGTRADGAHDNQDGRKIRLLDGHQPFFWLLEIVLSVVSPVSSLCRRHQAVGNARRRCTTCHLFFSNLYKDSFFCDVMCSVLRKR